MKEVQSLRQHANGVDCATNDVLISPYPPTPQKEGGWNITRFLSEVNDNVLQFLERITIMTRFTEIIREI